MAIVRAPRDGRFTIVPNATLRDRALSFRARGVLGFILSMPDGWSTTSEALADASDGEGRDAIRKSLGELEKHGYMVRQRQQDPVTGRWSTDVVVYDEPVEPVDDGAGPTPENPSSVPPAETSEQAGGADDWKPDRRWTRPHKEKTNYEDGKSTGRPPSGESRPRPSEYVPEGPPSAAQRAAAADAMRRARAKLRPPGDGERRVS